MQSMSYNSIGGIMVIAIEGMDGSGKSSVAKALALKFGYEYREMPNKHFLEFSEEGYQKVCEKIYKFPDNTIKGWFFGFGNILATQNVGRGVIIDRHLLSNYFWNGNDNNNGMYDELIKITGKPDLTIVLYAGVKERMQRIHKRNANDRDLDDDEKKVLGYDKMISFAKRVKFPYLVINTEMYDVDKTIKICECLIKKVESMDKIQVLEYVDSVNKRLYKKGKQPYSDLLNKVIEKE